MTLEELQTYTKSQNKHFKTGYLKKCVQFSEQDKSLTTEYNFHHIIPKCCGGTDDPRNLIKVSIKHHADLHKSIIGSYKPKKQSNTITKAQYKKLYYAMCLMNNIKLSYWLKPNFRQTEEYKRYVKYKKRNIIQ